MIDVSNYPLLVGRLSDDDGGGFFATIPDLQGCIGDGETEADAIADVRAAALEWIAECERVGRSVPEPGFAANVDAHARREMIEKINAQEEYKQELKRLGIDIAAIDARIAEIRASLSTSASGAISWPTHSVATTEIARALNSH
jgi:antitoxin HicB